MFAHLLILLPSSPAPPPLTLLATTSVQMEKKGEKQRWNNFKLSVFFLFLILV